MEPDDSPGEDRTDPDGESDRSASPPEANDPSRPVSDQWHGDPPEGWSEEKDGNVFGPGPGDEETRPPIEPGEPNLENVLFVLLGVLASIGALVHVVVSL